MDKVAARSYLEAFDYQSLFLQELGWDAHQGRPFSLELRGQTYVLHPIAQKREFQVLRMEGIPEHSVRVLLERQLNRMAAERLVVFEDRAGGRQLWEWALSERDRPFKLRTAEYRKGSSNELFLQKLEGFTFTLDEESGATTLEAGRRVRRAFDVEKVTKRFYEQFQKEHQAFFGVVSGLPEEARRWYTSLMLNRLMFVYFVQKKRFLDGNDNYLRNRLARVQALKGKGKFHSFYRDFLLVLFHDGLGSQQRPADPELLGLLGNIPYLNGGLFELHPLEAEHRDIQIPDEAFERVFSFFEQFEWHLDDRPLRGGNEINPDVLGYIFEKYINQKQMGAYYTKEDITEYIAKNTVLPHVIEATRQGCTVAFEGEGSLWKLLAQNPDRYIYEAVRRGADHPEAELPAFVQKGMHDPEARMFERRYNLGEANLKDGAGDPLTLPTETWREYVTRRGRYQELKGKLRSGQVQSVSDLITLNLNIRQFAQDVLDSADGADLLRSYWRALTEIKILDPTCGSGAFLFAALNILQPLYESALDKMEALVAEAEAGGSARYPDFRKTLAEVAKHPSDRYYVLKSIVVNNLYGVDIMEEATEIAKLRLFLKLMSQVERPDQIEPLPDVDFNIRSGNALVGFATEAELDKAMSAQLDLYNTKGALKEKLDDVEALSKRFRQQQTEYGESAKPAEKAKLREKLRELENELNRNLAAQYGLDPEKPKDYAKWKESHKPFHWFVDFYGIMKSGGFDAIIGNPPYLEVSAIKSQYRVVNFKTESSGNLYALCTERAVEMLGEGGSLGFIVQSPIASTQRMKVLRDVLESKSELIVASTFDDRPSKLFDGINHARVAIVLAFRMSDKHGLYVSRYHKWYTEERNVLFEKLIYAKGFSNHRLPVWPKLGSQVETDLAKKVISENRRLGSLISSVETEQRVFFKITGVGHWFTITLRPPKFTREGEASSSSREQSVSFTTAKQKHLSFSVMNSSLFYWFYQVRTNCRDFNPSDYVTFPIPEKLADADLTEVGQELMSLLDKTTSVSNVNHSKTGTIQVEQFRPKMAKPVIDEVDAILARHYGFTPEELDFIINYDIKYRMGRDALEE